MPAPSTGGPEQHGGAAKLMSLLIDPPPIEERIARLQAMRV
jgi:hypothetical protein